MNKFDVSIDMIRPIEADSMGDAMALVVVKLHTSDQLPVPCGAHDIQMTLRLEPADSIEALLQSAHTQMPEILREAARQIQARPTLLERVE